MVRGPLIPGIEEFDAPRRPVPRIWWWLLLLVVASAGVVLVLGVFRGVGPLSSLGWVTEELQPVAYRPTANEQVVQVAIAVPSGGLCRDDDVNVVGTEGSDRIEVQAWRTRLRNAGCQQVPAAGDQVWVDVNLTGPAGARIVVRAADGGELPRETETGVG